MRQVIYIIIAAGALVLMGAHSAAAQHGSPFAQRLTGDQARDACNNGRFKCAREVIKTVKKRYPNFRHSNTYLAKGKTGRPEYVVKMINKQGHMIEVYVDAQTGRIIRSRGY